MSFEAIGSIRRIASIVAGAAGSQRALKWRSPTSIWSVVIDVRSSSWTEDSGDRRPRADDLDARARHRAGDAGAGRAGHAVTARRRQGPDPDDPGADRCGWADSRSARTPARGRRLPARVRC